MDGIASMKKRCPRCQGNLRMSPVDFGAHCVRCLYYDDPRGTMPSPINMQRPIAYAFLCAESRMGTGLELPA